QRRQHHAGDDVLDQPFPPVRGDRAESGHGGQNAPHVVAQGPPRTRRPAGAPRGSPARDEPRQCSSILSTIITPPNAAATAADTSRSRVESFHYRPTSKYALH